jgi:hypothetical protein
MTFLNKYMLITEQSTGEAGPSNPSKFLNSAEVSFPSKTRMIEEYKIK